MPDQLLTGPQWALARETGADAARPLSTACPSAGWSAGPLLLLTLWPALLVLASREVGVADEAAALTVALGSTVGLAFGAGLVRIPLAQLIGRRLRRGDPVTVPAAIAGALLFAGPAAAVVGGGITGWWLGEWTLAAVLAGSISGAGCAAFVGASALSAADERERVTGALGTGLAVGGGLAVAAGRLAGAPGLALGASVGVACAAAVLLGRATAAGRGSAATTALVRAVRAPGTVALGLFGTVAWLGPFGLGPLETVALPAAAAFLVTIPSLLIVFHREEPVLAYAHRELFAAIEADGALREVEAALDRARTAVQRATVRTLVVAFATLAVGLTVAPVFTEEIGGAGVFARALVGLVALATSIPGQAGLAQINAAGLAALASSPAALGLLLDLAAPAATRGLGFPIGAWLQVVAVAVVYRRRAPGTVARLVLDELERSPRHLLPAVPPRAAR